MLFRISNCTAIIFRQILNRKLLIRRKYTDYKDPPVKFSTSEASGWKAEFSRQGLNKPDDSVWFESWIILASLSVFLLYFCVFREENDIDEELSMSLYDRIDGLKVQPKNYLAYSSTQGKDTSAIIAKLKEIE